LQAAIEENLDGNPARPALLGELKHSRTAWALAESGWLWGRRFLDHTTPTPPTAWMRDGSWGGENPHPEEDGTEAYPRS
jgi:hypothetical protein